MKPPIPGSTAAGHENQTSNEPIRAAETRYFHEILKENNYPFAWYLQREPRKLIVGPKGFGDGKDYFEIGPVTMGAGYSQDNKGNVYALSTEGISIAAKLGLKFTYSETENRLPLHLVNLI